VARIGKGERVRKSSSERDFLSASMEKICAIGLLAFVLVASGASATEIPNLVGTWEGPDIGYDALEGYYGDGMENIVTLTITEQRGRLFSGTITYLDRNETEVVEGLAGVIGFDDKTFYLAEFISGYDMGTIVSEDEIELVYIHDGEMGGAAIDTLRRVAE
jgi:hypothetical protein